MHMESCHKVVKDICIKEGAADVRFCTYRGADTAVLFFPYGINPEEHGRETFLSGYYPVSNTAYHAAKRVCAELRNRGIYAEHVTDIPARYCALKCGGHIIKNGMYSHPALGCNVHLQTVLLGDMTEEEEHVDSSLFEVCCSDCGRCAEACPFGAVSDIFISFSDANGASFAALSALKPIYRHIHMISVNLSSESTMLTLRISAGLIWLDL